MKKESVKFLRVKDDPVVATAVPVANAVGGNRVFQLADQVTDLWLGSQGYPIRPFRFEIPCDNSEGTEYMGVYMTGRMSWTPQIDSSEIMRMQGFVITRWDEYGFSEPSMSATEGGSVGFIPHVKTTQYFPPTAPSGSYEQIHDSVVFLASGIVKPGVGPTSLFVELWLEDLGSTDSVYIQEADGWVQGIVAGNVEKPYPESFYVESGDPVGSWTDDPNFLDADGGIGYGVEYPRYNRSRIGDP